jgi:hypothetical protein
MDKQQTIRTVSADMIEISTQVMRVENVSKKSIVKQIEILQGQIKLLQEKLDLFELK